MRIATQRRKTKRARTRAVSESAKRQRRTDLLRVAERLFSSRDYKDVSMNDIANGAALAKGTLYLYFDTKEELFLELVSEGMQAWFNEVRELPEDTTQRTEDLAAAIASTLSNRPTLIRLLALLHILLEQNTCAPSLKLFKQRLLRLTTETAAYFERILQLPLGEGFRAVLWMHAIVVGLAQMTSPSPALVKVLVDNPALAAFHLDFRSELERSLIALFSGVRLTTGAGCPS